MVSYITFQLPPLLLLLLLPLPHSPSFFFFKFLILQVYTWIMNSWPYQDLFEKEKEKLDEKRNFQSVLELKQKKFLTGFNFKIVLVQSVVKYRSQQF